MVDNWIERMDSRDRILSECTTLLWLAVGTKLDETCTYFNEKHSHIGKLQNRPENGNRIIVALTPADAHMKLSYVQYQIDAGKQRISVTVNGGTTKHFKIDADDSVDSAHCIIKNPAGDRVSVDQFAEITLHDVLFKSPAAPKPRSRSAKAGPWD